MHDARRTRTKLKVHILFSVEMPIIVCDGHPIARESSVSTPEYSVSICIDESVSDATHPSRVAIAIVPVSSHESAPSIPASSSSSVSRSIDTIACTAATGTFHAKNSSTVSAHAMPAFTSVAHLAWWRLGQQTSRGCGAPEVSVGSCSKRARPCAHAERARRVRKSAM